MDGVQTHLLDVSECQVPRQIGNHIVEGDSRTAPEAMVITTDGASDAISKERSYGMGPQVMTVAQDLVANGAALKADVLFLDQLDQIWMHDKIEAMTDSLSAEENGVIELRIGSLGALSCMEEELHAITHLHLYFHQLFKKSVTLLVVVFFANKIKAGHHLGK